MIQSEINLESWNEILENAISDSDVFIIAEDFHSPKKDPLQLTKAMSSNLRENIIKLTE